MEKFDLFAEINETSRFQFLVKLAFEKIKKIIRTIYLYNGNRVVLHVVF